jgi:hypothetical protein
MRGGIRKTVVDFAAYAGRQGGEEEADAIQRPLEENNLLALFAPDDDFGKVEVEGTDRREAGHLIPFRILRVCRWTLRKSELKAILPPFSHLLLSIFEKVSRSVSFLLRTRA